MLLNSVIGKRASIYSADERYSKVEGTDYRHIALRLSEVAFLPVLIQVVVCKTSQSEGFGN